MPVAAFSGRLTVKEAVDRATGASAHAKVFRVLTALEELGPGAHELRRITSKSGLPRSTVQRILACGVEEGQIELRGQGLYSITPHSGALRGLRLPQVASQGADPDLTQLQRQTAQVVLLFVTVPLARRLWVDTVYGRRYDFVEALTSEDSAALELSPLSADAAGLVISAHSEDETVSNRFREIQELGTCFTRSPLPGWSMIAAPVYGRAGHVEGALALLGQHPRMFSEKTRFSYEVLRTAARVSRRSENALRPVRSSSQLAPVA